MKNKYLKKIAEKKESLTDSIKHELGEEAIQETDFGKIYDKVTNNRRLRKYKTLRTIASH